MQFSRKNKAGRFLQNKLTNRSTNIKGGFYRKKKVVSALLCATMVATMFAGCGSKESSDNATTPVTSKADTSSEVTAPAEDTGKVLNIYCWNEEFKSRIQLLSGYRKLMQHMERSVMLMLSGTLHQTMTMLPEQSGCYLIKSGRCPSR